MCIGETAGGLLVIELRVGSVSENHVPFVVLPAAHANVFIDCGTSGEDSEWDGLMEFGVVSSRDFDSSVFVRETVVLPFIVVVEHRRIGVNGGDESLSAALRIA